MRRDEGELSEIISEQNEINDKIYNEYIDTWNVK